MTAECCKGKKTH